MLNERILKLKEKIRKKEKTIQNKHKAVENKKKKLIELGVIEPSSADMYDYTNNNEVYWLLSDIKRLHGDIKRGSEEIENMEQTLEKYLMQFEGENEKSDIIKNVPEVLKKLLDELVDSWNTWDIEKRNNIQQDYKLLGWRECSKKYSRSDFDFKDKTDEQINKDNIQYARDLIVDLYQRIKNKTGEITDWSNIHDSKGHLNGFVIGDKGTAEVESIIAGGYNIQRLHIRVLVK